MYMGQNVSREFSGDIYGYIPYMSIIKIDGLVGEYMFIEYDYDTETNIISCKLKQVFHETVEVQATTFPDYGETTKPTVIG